MVSQREIDDQLNRLGIKIRYWGKAEVKELSHILMPGEKIACCINGRYEGGFAMLCTTDQRVLLVDKKPMYLTVEDIRYDMISEVDFHSRLLDSTINIMTPGKQLRFTGFTQKPVRDMTTYIQNRVMEFRQGHMMQDMHVLTQSQTDAIQDEGRRPLAAAEAEMEQEEHKESKDVVRQLQFRVTNPYTKVPLMMRRRVSRFYGTSN